MLNRWNFLKTGFYEGIKVGFLGSDSSHAERFSEILNVEDHAVYWPESGAQVRALWGEDPVRTAEVAEYGRIPVVARHPEEVVAESDMVFVITRHAGTHLELARLAIEAGKPLFVDKPMTQTPGKAEELLSLVKVSGVPMTSFSLLRYGSDADRYGERLRGIGPVRYASYVGPASRISQYGGLLFYAIHCVELMLQFHGTEVVSVHAIENPAGGKGSNVTATCGFADGTLVTLALVSDGAYHFHMTAIGKDGVADVALETGDYYSTGMRKLLPVLRGEETSPVSHEEMLRAIQVCAALDESLQKQEAVDPRTTS